MYAVFGVALELILENLPVAVVLRYTLYPITLELGFHDRLTLYCVTVPTPVSGSGVDELEALLANEREPETVPLFWGVNATLNETL